MLMAEEVTESLVILNAEQHMDLASLNLQRGRDHALPGKSSTESVFNGFVVFAEACQSRVTNNKQCLFQKFKTSSYVTLSKHLSTFLLFPISNLSSF